MPQSSGEVIWELIFRTMKYQTLVTHISRYVITLDNLDGIEGKGKNKGLLYMLSEWRSRFSLKNQINKIKKKLINFSKNESLYQIAKTFNPNWSKYIFLQENLI